MVRAVAFYNAVLVLGSMFLLSEGMNMRRISQYANVAPPQSASNAASADIPLVVAAPVSSYASGWRPAATTPVLPATSTIDAPSYLPVAGLVPVHDQPSHNVQPAVPQIQTSAQTASYSEVATTQPAAPSTPIVFNMQPEAPQQQYAVVQAAPQVAQPANGASSYVQEAIVPVTSVQQASPTMAHTAPAQPIIIVAPEYSASVVQKPTAPIAQASMLAYKSQPVVQVATGLATVNSANSANARYARIGLNGAYEQDEAVVPVVVPVVVMDAPVQQTLNDTEQEEGKPLQSSLDDWSSQDTLLTGDSQSALNGTTYETEDVAQNDTSADGSADAGLFDYTPEPAPGVPVNDSGNEQANGATEEPTLMSTTAPEGIAIEQQPTVQTAGQQPPQQQQYQLTERHVSVQSRRIE